MEKESWIELIKKMKDVYISSDNILSPIGSTAGENFEQLLKLASGIKKHENTSMSEQPFYASLFNGDENFIDNNSKGLYTKFEQLLIGSISDALKNSKVKPNDKKAVLIISSTKGNISLLETATVDPSLILLYMRFFISIGFAVGLLISLALVKSIPR